MDGGDEQAMTGGPTEVTEGEWAGWWTWQGSDAFEDHAGPFYFRHEADGKVRCAFRAAKQHMNGGGAMHGGAMLTFADFALFAIGHAVWRKAGVTDHHVTVSLNGDFVGPAHVSDLVEATGEVVRAGGSLSFIRGLIETGGQPMMTFSGVVKRVKRR
ncbi:MAG: PaaI family thioesterase [Pseudomonadota bacterium]|nr:PaaI family thioesterase [Pseudomonadota bacterium]